mmetsp:Transcript_105353/g.187300  ORF Transcript_105353/g.187300 Transcript_105353/m.187300 type:complete len:237 (-) Transcript_105353:47-757(-)
MDGKLPSRIFLASLVILAVSLQGCSISAPTHELGYWQQVESYLTEYKLDPWATNSSPNSCTSDLPLYLQCNGHGTCSSWNGKDSKDSSLKFCYCLEDWADPNCGTARKSQSTAFLISMFGGFLGLDLLYLGFWFPWGLVKLFTLGGLGIWWVYDIVRIGSSPVSTASSFKVAANVPHWVFVLSVLSLFAFLGFGFGAWMIHRSRVQKAKEVMMLKAEGASMASSGRSFSGYGSTLF